MNESAHYDGSNAAFNLAAVFGPGWNVGQRALPTALDIHGVCQVDRCIPDPRSLSLPSPQSRNETPDGARHRSRICKTLLRKSQLTYDTNASLEHQPVSGTEGYPVNKGCATTEERSLRILLRRARRRSVARTTRRGRTRRLRLQFSPMARVARHLSVPDHRIYVSRHLDHLPSHLLLRLVIGCEVPLHVAVVASHSKTRGIGSHQRNQFSWSYLQNLQILRLRWRPTLSAARWWWWFLGEQRNKQQSNKQYPHKFGNHNRPKAFRSVKFSEAPARHTAKLNKTAKDPIWQTTCRLNTQEVERW